MSVTIAGNPCFGATMTSQTSVVTKFLAITFACVLAFMVLFGMAVTIQNDADRDAANARESARRAALTPTQRAQEDSDRARANAERHAAEQLADALDVARGACLQMFERRLDDPDSAKYGRVSDWPAQQRKDGTVYVLPTIRAKNAFGAYRLTNFECIVERIDADHVRVNALNQLSP